MREKGVVFEQTKLDPKQRLKNSILVQTGSRVFVYAQKVLSTSTELDFFELSNFSAGLNMPRANPTVSRISPSMISFADEFIFTSGGYKTSTWRVSNSVELYDVHANNWLPAP